MSESKHTELRVSGEDDYYGDTVFGLTNEGRIVAQFFSYDTTSAEDSAARMILTWNCHDDLLEALNHAEAILSRSQQISTNCSGRGPSTTTTKALKMVRAALAATEVKT